MLKQNLYDFYLKTFIFYNFKIAVHCIGVLWGTDVQNACQGQWFTIFKLEPHFYRVKMGLTGGKHYSFNRGGSNEYQQSMFEQNKSQFYLKSKR